MDLWLNIVILLVIATPGLIFAYNCVRDVIRRREVTCDDFEAFAIFFPPIYVLLFVVFWGVVLGATFNQTCRKELKDFLRG